MPDRCHQCGCMTVSIKPQVFKNGEKHLREECAQCGAFIKWRKQENKSFREQLFEVVKNLAACETKEQFSLLKAQAQQLVQRVERPSVAEPNQMGFPSLETGDKIVAQEPAYARK